MKRLMLLLFTAYCLSPATAANSVVITAPSSKVSRIIKYADDAPDFANALVINVTNLADATVCNGGWIRTSDSQYDDVLQLVLAARLTDLNIRLDGNPGDLFPGSSDKYCHINLVMLN